MGKVERLRVYKNQSYIIYFDAEADVDISDDLTWIFDIIILLYM